MYRIILILALLLVLYFLLRSAIRELKGRGGGERLPLDKNQMVQDPVCRVFVPRGSATTEDIGGQTYYFCSRTCANMFEKQLAGQQPE
jgi:YHS domain-containing protein